MVVGVVGVMDMFAIVAQEKKVAEGEVVEPEEAVQTNQASLFVRSVHKDHVIVEKVFTVLDNDVTYRKMLRRSNL